MEGTAELQHVEQDAQLKLDFQHAVRHCANRKQREPQHDSRVTYRWEFDHRYRFYRDAVQGHGRKDTNTKIIFANRRQHKHLLELEGTPELEVGEPGKHEGQSAGCLLHH